MSEGTQRKLAAIVSADVVGYSRVMGIDEAGTHAQLKARYDKLVAPRIAGYGGRVVKLMGDGLLAEFPSIVNAAEWAILGARHQRHRGIVEHLFAPCRRERVMLQAEILVRSGDAGAIDAHGGGLFLKTRAKYQISKNRFRNRDSRNKTQFGNAQSRRWCGFAQPVVSHLTFQL